MERLTDEQLQTVGVDLLEWYYGQAEKRHADLVRVETVITGRGYALLAIYFALLSASVGYVLTHLDVSGDVAVTSGCLSLAVFSCVAIGYVCQVVWPHPFYAPGKEPDSFQIPAYIAYFKDGKLDERSQKKRVVGDELLVLQDKCEKQDADNARRSSLIRHSIGFMLFGSAVAVILFFASAVFL